MKTYPCLLLALVLSGCATQESPDVLTPINAIQLAQNNVAGVSITIVMQVRSVGAGSGPEEGFIFLNSAEDYRSPQNVSVAIAPFVVREFKEKLAIAPDVKFRNQTIQVSGLVQRVRKDLVIDNQLTGKFYYQTHLSINSPDQVEILPTK